MKAIPVACPSFQFYVPSTPQYGIKLPMKSPLPPPLPPPPPQQHHCPASPHPRTSVIVHGISSPRTFELCPICPIPSILPKLQAILAADRRECWIPASVIDIATAGREGMYLGWRYRAPSSSSSFSSSSVLPPSRTWQRWVWKEGTKEEARKRDVEQEDGGGGDEELKRLCEVLIQMAGQCRHVELRLCRGSKEVHAYRVVAVAAVLLVAASALICGFAKGWRWGNWFQSILLNLISSAVFGCVAWAFWRPRDE